MITPLTIEQQCILTGFTGKNLCIDFCDFHADVERRLGEPVFIHQFGDATFEARVKELYTEDFLRMMQMTAE